MKSKSGSKPKYEKVPSTISEHYSRYRNSKVHLKKTTILNSVFEVDSKYEVLEPLGQGAYGLVASARDKTTSKNEGGKIAIKKIEKSFEHRVFAKRTLRELKILRCLQHENIIGIKTILLPKSREEFENIYVVLELMESDLSSIIKSPQPLTNDHIKFFTYQILRGLKYMHSAGIIHRDLKPRNLLINSNCDVKICDFGLARHVFVANTVNDMTNYVATRWYRPPELLLETKEYGPAIDVWSVGCIFAELFKRKPFLPGTDTTSQLDLIFNTLGTPCEEDLVRVQQPKLKSFLKSVKTTQGRCLETLLPQADSLAIDLLKKMLTFNPNHRITVEDALKHPYFSDLHCPDDEPTRELIPPNEFLYERYTLTVEQMKDLLYEETLLYHFGDFRKEYFKKVFAGDNPFTDVIENDHGSGRQ